MLEFGFVVVTGDLAIVRLKFWVLLLDDGKVNPN